MEDLNYEKIKQLLAHTDPNNQELGLHLLKGLGLQEDVELFSLMTDRVEKLYWCIKYEWMEQLGKYPKAIKNIIEVVDKHIQDHFDLSNPHILVQILEISPFLKIVEGLKNKDHFEEDGVKSDKLEFYLTHHWRKQFGEIKRLDLTNMDLNWELLEHLPDFFALEYLSLYNTSMQEISFKLEVISSLKTLELGKNPNLKDYSSLAKLKELEIVGMGYNQLRMIPKAVLELKSLHEIDLRSNHIAFLPNEIYELKQLKVLNLKRNKIGQLSPKIQQLEKLEELLLQKNHLIDIPAELMEMQQLKKIDLRSNPVIELEKDKIKALEAALPNCKIRV
jgi:hypothetical protein